MINLLTLLFPNNRYDSKMVTQAFVVDSLQYMKSKTSETSFKIYGMPITESKLIWFYIVPEVKTKEAMESIVESLDEHGISNLLAAEKKSIGQAILDVPIHNITYTVDMFKIIADTPEYEDNTVNTHFNFSCTTSINTEFRVGNKTFRPLTSAANIIIKKPYMAILADEKFKVPFFIEYQLL